MSDSLSSSVSCRLLRPPPPPSSRRLLLPHRPGVSLLSRPQSFPSSAASIGVSSRRTTGLVAAATARPNRAEEFRLDRDTIFDADDDGPTSVELAHISSEEQFDRIVDEARRVEEPVVVLWMAEWCRKCIFLKPKLEKLAAVYYPRIKFYYVDVNTVPQRLVNRAEVTKMPAVQLWKDGKKQDEVIGGHKEWLVINEVQKMIESEECSDTCASLAN